MRRFLRFGRMLLALGALACGSAVEAQGPGPVPQSQLVVEPDRDVVQALAEARQSIERKQYHSAVQLLQLVLDRPEDGFLERDFLDDHGMRGGTRAEAVRLLLSLPVEGLAAYELEYGAAARQQLDAAAAADDLPGIEEVVRRFAATAAGYDATLRLAASASDRNCPLEAALLLEPLRQHPRRTPQLSLQRAVYWTRAGRLARGVAALRELKRTVPAGQMRIGGRELPLPVSDDDATRFLRSLAGSHPVAGDAVAGWLMAAGGPARNVSAATASPAGGHVWRTSLLEHLVLDGRPDHDQRHRERLKKAVDHVVQQMRDENQPLIPAAQPLVIGDIVVYRTPGDVSAVSLGTGRMLWRSAVVEESLVRLMNPRTLEFRLRAARGINLPTATLDGFLERRLHRDLAAGTLSSDGQSVFSLEELDSAAAVSTNAFGVAEPRAVNKLAAYDLAGGRMLWEVGGQRGAPPMELSAQFFLGPPLPLEGRLYVISEAQGALQLLALRQADDRQSVGIDWSQTLIAADQPLASQPLRRLSGLSPSSAEGILVCPTSSGAVVAIDLARRGLLWGFQYPSLVQPDPHSFGVQAFPRAMQQEFLLEEADRAGRWMDSAPLIAEGKVLVTPRDSDTLYCLDLVDGHELWRMPRDDWMYVACVLDGRAILVGRHGVGAIRLGDGTPLESFADADVEPTGRGVRVGRSYYLPTARGEIATIDLQTGHVLARSKLAGGLVPGNLVAGDGAIVSQSATELVAFGRLSAIQQQIVDRLRADPGDAPALALRGELRLHAGDQALGMADLRESLRRNPDPRVKLVLAAALLSSVRAEPARIRDSVAELEAITDDPQQRNEFLRLYSQALEATGDRRGAFAQMIRLAETSRFLDDLKPVESGYSVRTDRSVRARLIEMYAAAPRDEQAELDRIVQQHIRAASNEPGFSRHLERCVRFFRGLPTVDTILLHSALELAPADRQHLLRSLQHSDDAAVAGRVTAMRCAELIQSRTWPEAAAQIKTLRREFADQECLDGQTGRSLAAKWSAIPELQGLLAVRAAWPGTSIDVRRFPVAAPAQPVHLPVEIASRSGVVLAGWTFESDAMGSVLVARDEFGALQWKLALPTDPEHNDPETRNPAIPFQAHIVDHWIVLSRMTYFHVVNASSIASPQIVWHQSLKAASDGSEPEMHLQMRVNGRIGRTTAPLPRSGKVLGLTRETVIYALGSRLQGAELETGRLVWSRQDATNGQFEGSVDERSAAIFSTGSITLLRALDGSRIARRAPQPGVPLWNRGRRMLLRRSNPGGVTFELKDLERDVVIWERECQKETLASVIEGDDVAFLEPDGRMVVVRLSDQGERYQTQLPLKLAPGKSWFTVERSMDRDLVLGGESYRHRSALQIVPFESGTRIPIPFDGYVCAVSNADGRLLWSTPVEKAAFDQTQPSSLPVLLLATRQFDGRNGGNPFFQRFRMTAYLIDKRTGRKIYSTDETAPAMAPRLEPDPDHDRIIANFHDWRLELTFGNGVEVKPDPDTRQDEQN